MAVSEWTLWRGGFVATYWDEVERWVEESKTEMRFDLSAISPSDPELFQAVSDDGFWLEPEKSVLLDHINAWKAADVDALVKQLVKGETSWRVGAIQREGNVLKSIERVTTRERDLRISFDVDGLAEWTTEWLGERGVTLHRGVALQLAERAGEEPALVIDTAIVLAQSCAGRELSWDEVMKYAGDRGVVPGYQLTSAIARGDRAASLEIIDRLWGSLHPLQILATLMNRYRSYLMVVDARISPEEAAVLVGTSPGAARYLMKEARLLQTDWVVESFQEIAAVERGLKGESAADHRLQLELLVIGLSNRFHRALR